MTIIQAIFFGILQGLTEFIPISSSGHLVLAHYAFGAPDGGLVFDVALHLGTLVALLVYFNKDLVELFLALFKKSEKTKLAYILLVATIPAVIAGVLLESAAESAFRSPFLVSFNLAFFGLVMLFAEKLYEKNKDKTTLDKVSNKQGIAMGFAQAAAIVPGVSRSGSTITMGLFVGLDRVSATRFSFLLGVPIIAGASLKVLVSGSGLNQISSEPAIFITGILTAFLAGLFAIKFLLRYLAKHSLAIFAYYRIGLAALVILLLLIN